MCRSSFVSGLLGALLVAACSSKSSHSVAGPGDAAMGGGQNDGSSTSGGAAGSGGEAGAGEASGGTGGVGGSGGGTSAGGASGSSGGESGGSPPVDASLPDTGISTSCNSPADCPAPGTVCQKAACFGNQCGFVANPSATPPGNKSGDCRTIVCSQSGTETVLVDPNDKDDGNECTADSCSGNVATHTPSVGQRCQSGTKFCDSMGACVQCLSDSQCPGTPTECGRGICVQGTCRLPAPGTPCNSGRDQCDGSGSCVDCIDDRGCDMCCFCLSNICVQG
jgi:hypothetical protein